MKLLTAELPRQPTASKLGSMRRFPVSHSEWGSGSFTCHSVHQRRHF
jgi:hypothetical protein